MDGTMRTGLKIALVISFLFLPGSGDFQVWGLRVTGKDVPTEALRGEDVTIPCLLSGVPISLNLEKLSVIWTLRLQNGTEREVYGFRSYQHTPLRPGSHMHDEDLQQGNASLSIPNIQITDEGNYRCFVIFTPDSSSATSTLQVSVKPQMALSHDQQIEDGITGSVRCEVSNFYPEAVKIRWVKSSKSNSRNSSLERDVCALFRNSDGTFNVTSVLTVEPTTDAEPGDVFFCIVSHRSLEEEMTLSFTMPRWNPAISNSLPSVAFTISCVTYCLRIFFNKRSGPRMKVVLGVIFMVSSITVLVLSGLSLHFLRNFSGASKVIISVLIILVLLMLPTYWILFWRDFKTDVLTISEISGDRRITHMKKTTLTCQITYFGQKEIQINVFLKRRNAIKKQLIASWEPTKQIPSNNSIALLLEGDAEHQTVLPVKMTKSCIGIYKYLCFITIIPSADIDDGAVLGVEVEHASLKQPISACRTLNVYNTVADNTIISDIIGETWLPHMEETTLSFQITGFRTKEIHINLYLKRRKDMKKDLILSWVSVDSPSGESNNTTYDTTLPVEMEVEMTEAEDGSHKCDCRISLTPDPGTDDGAVLSVEVTHAALQWPLYKYHILNVIKGDKPSLWRRWNKLFIK